MSIYNAKLIVLDAIQLKCLTWSAWPSLDRSAGVPINLANQDGQKIGHARPIHRGYCSIRKSRMEFEKSAGPHGLRK